MALLISNAILHSIGNEEHHVRFSDIELDVDSETCSEFISKHVQRLLRNPAAKEAVFTANSPIYTLVKAFQNDELHFSDLSKQLCEQLAAIMKNNEDISPSDVLVAFFDSGNKSYLALIKLNYGECFTHKRIDTENGKAENSIVKNTVVLPLSTSKVEEACLIPYDPMILRVIEKPHIVGNESVNYFSELFLQCETQMSKKETADTIREIADEINATYFDGSIETAANLKTALIAESEAMQDDDGLVLENVVDRAFGENCEAKDAFVTLIKEYGLPHQIALDKSFVKREFKTQRYKAENGVEIKFPAELLQDPNQIQLAVNADGSTTITLKNLRPAEL